MCLTGALCHNCIPSALCHRSDLRRVKDSCQKTVASVSNPVGKIWEAREPRESVKLAVFINFFTGVDLLADLSNCEYYSEVMWFVIYRHLNTGRKWSPPHVVSIH